MRQFVQIPWLLFCFVKVQCNIDAGVVYLPMPATPEKSLFRITETSRPSLVVRVGDSVSLSCRTNRPWDLCGWKLPTGEWCDRLMNASKFTTACHQNPRIKYDKPTVYRLDNSNFQSDCGITIVDVSADDDGTWICHAKENVRQDMSVESSITISVASPYTLELVTPPVATSQLSFSLLNKTEEMEIICLATGRGNVKPKLSWNLEGKDVDRDHVKSWTETHSSGEELIYLALTINANFLDQFFLGNVSDDVYQNLVLRCNSKQLYPNGTVIFQSSIATDLLVQVRETIQEADEFAGDMNVAGLTIVILLALATLVAIVLICWSKKYKKWCYAKENVAGRAVTRTDDISQVQISEEQIGFMDSRVIPFSDQDQRAAPVTTTVTVRPPTSPTANGTTVPSTQNEANLIFIDENPIQTSSSGATRPAGPGVQLTPIEEQQFTEAFNFEPQILPVAKEIHQNLAAPAITTEEEVFEIPIHQEPATSSLLKSQNVPISALRAAFFEQSSSSQGEVDINGNSNRDSYQSAFEETKSQNESGEEDQSFANNNNNNSSSSSSSNRNSSKDDMNNNNNSPNLSPTAPPFTTRSPQDELPSLPDHPPPPLEDSPPLPPASTLPPSPLPPVSSLPPPPLPPSLRSPSAQPLTFLADVQVEPVVQLHSEQQPQQPQRGRMDPNRLLELISAPPASLDVTDRQVANSSSALPPYTTNAPPQSNRLSSALTSPRKPNTRRQNEYVTVSLKPRVPSLVLPTSPSSATNENDVTASRLPVMTSFGSPSSPNEVELRRNDRDVEERRPISETAL